MAEEMETNIAETTTTAEVPDTQEGRMQAILDRTGYAHEVTSGQRKYGGPPPNWEGPQPGPRHEVFCGKIPKDVFEDELIPLFEQCGVIWDLRLMLDPATAQGRGFCFVTFVEKSAADQAVKMYDGYEIRPNKKLKINVSIPNSRLFVGNIPKNKSKDEIFIEISNLTEGLKDVIIYALPDDPKKKNRGFAFLDYDCHKSAASAKKKLSGGRVKVFTCDVIVDWADPQEEPDDETMSKVKVLYVRNLKADVTEEQLREAFTKFGEIEKAKKVKDYGFIHFCERENAVAALEALNGTKINDSTMLISLAKPPIDAKLKEKRKMQHMMMLGQKGIGPMDPFAFGMPVGGMGPQRLMSGGMRGRMRPPAVHRGAMRGGLAAMSYDMDYYGGYGGYNAYGNEGYGEEYDYYGTGGYGGYEDYSGYEDYDSYYPAPVMPVYPPMRPRGAARGMMAMPGRGRVGIASRVPRVMAAAAGARAAARGMRGGMGRRPMGRGMDGRGGANAPRGGIKRKAAGDTNQAEMKKMITQDSWGAQPIAQQPLSQMAGFGTGADEWYQDSYGYGGAGGWA